MRFEIQELNNQFNSIFRNSDDMTSHDDLGSPSGLDYPINSVDSTQDNVDKV